MNRALLAALLLLAAGAVLYVLLRPSHQPNSMLPRTQESAPAPEESLNLPPVNPSPAQNSPPPSHSSPAHKIEKPFDLSRKIEDASRALPTLAEIRKLPPEALHRTPEPVSKANALIGEVAEATAQDPSRASESLAFYGDCARREKVVDSVRALCLTKMRELSRSSGLPLVEDGISPEVKRISDFVVK